MRKSQITTPKKSSKPKKIASVRKTSKKQQDRVALQSFMQELILEQHSYT